MSETQAEEIVAALEPVEEPKPKRAAKKAAPKAENQTMRARAIVLGRLKDR
jgi:hypothetical protein